MSLIFGNLTNQFVLFQIARTKAEAGDQDAINSLPAVAAAFRTVAAKDASYLVAIGKFIVFPRYIAFSFLLGCGMFACTYIYMFTWVYTGEVNAKRIRERYLQAVLRQDIQFFDNVGAGEVATRIQTDTRASFFPRLILTRNNDWLSDLVQQGISEKVALVVNFLSQFVTGFVLAYARSWRLALALSSILPCIGITGALMNKFVSKYMQ